MDNEKTEDPRGGKPYGLFMLPRNATVGWGARLIIQKNWEHERWERERERRLMLSHDYHSGFGYRKKKRKVKLPRMKREPKRYVIDFVWDRQAAYGYQEDKDKLLKRLNKGGKKRNAMAKAIREIERLFNDYTWKMMSSSPRFVYRDDEIEIVADPRGSGGYVYVCAYYVKDANLPPQPEQASGTAG